MEKQNRMVTVQKFDGLIVKESQNVCLLIFRTEENRLDQTYLHRACLTNCFSMDKLAEINADPHFLDILLAAYLAMRQKTMDHNY